MTDCLFCKGHLTQKNVSRVQEYQGRWYLLENIPALVCQQCGETYYSPEAHDRALALVKAGKPSSRTETLIVLDAHAA